MIERFIDYLQFQCDVKKSECYFNEFEQISGIAFYPIGFRDGFGTRYYFGNPKSPSCLCVMSGSALLKRREWGIGDVETLDWAFAHDAKFSRIDFAVTEWVSDNLFLVEDVKKWYEQGLVTSVMVDGGAKFISGYADGISEQVETFYIGSISKRAKKGLFRAYDKGQELNIGQYLSTRIEYEDRGEKAHNSAKRMLETASFSGVFRSRFDVKSSDFERLMDAAAIGIQRGAGKPKTEKQDEMNKRFEWLMKQVAPALREFVEFDASEDVNMLRVSEFLAASGLSSHMRDVAGKLAELKYYDMIESRRLSHEREKE